MNQPHILLQDDGFNLFTDPIKNFAKKNGYDLTAIPRFELDKTGRAIRDNLDDWDKKYPLLVIGSLGLVRDFVNVRQKRSTTSIPNDIQNFTPNKWKELFGLSYINHNGVLLDVARLHAQWHGHREPLYLRDAGPFKKLRGGLYTRRDFRIVSALSELRDHSEIFAAVVTQENDLEEEYGIVVVDGKVTATLMTKQNGLMRMNSYVALPHGMARFVEREIIPVFPEKEYLVNVAYTRRTSEFKIVDFNPLNHWIWPDENIASQVYTAWMDALIKREKEKEDV